MTTSTEGSRVLCNDDGWILAQYESLTPDLMREKMIAPYEGSPVDTFLWSVGGHEVYDYETRVGEVFGEGFGEGFGEFDDPWQQRRVANFKSLTQDHGGPVTVITQLCKEAGLKFMPSIRMNEHYDMEESSPTYGRFRRDNPHLLIGRPGEQLGEGSIEWGIRTGKNYAFPEVRAHMARIIYELIERWDVDGIELDFMRHPAYFRADEGYANRYLATDLVRRVRRRLDEAGAERGKSLELVARVPPTIADSQRIGLDVVTWMREGLVDLLIGGGGFIPFETPIREFVEAAQGTGCHVLGCFEALRPNLEEEMLRAVATRYWRDGVSGIYLFNYFNLPNEWKRIVLRDVATPDALTRLDKRYELDRSARNVPARQLSLTFRHAIPFAQLPVTLEETMPGVGATLRMDIADDVEASAAEGALGRCSLRLGLDSLEADDEIEATFNGVPLSLSEAVRSADGWPRTSYKRERRGYPMRTQVDVVDGHTLELDVGSPPLRNGVNELMLRLVKRAPSRAAPAVLEDVSLSIAYR